MGALFNQMVEKLNHWRAHHTNPFWVRRVFEVAMLSIVTCSVAMLMPAAYGCKQTSREMLLLDSVGCMSEEDALQVAHGRVTHAALVHIIGNDTAYQQQAQADLLKWRVEASAREDDHWKDEVWLSNEHDVLAEVTAAATHGVYTAGLFTAHDFSAVSESLIVTVDGADRTVVLAANIASTAQAVVAINGGGLAGATATTDSYHRVIISSASYGPNSTVEIAASSGANALGLLGSGAASAGHASTIGRRRLGGAGGGGGSSGGASKVHLHYQQEYECDTEDYNEMAMLWLNSGVKAVKVLLQRGFPHMLSWQALLAFFGCGQRQPPHTHNSPQCSQRQLPPQLPPAPGQLSPRSRAPATCPQPPDLPADRPLFGPDSPRLVPGGQLLLRAGGLLLWRLSPGRADYPTPAARRIGRPGDGPARHRTEEVDLRGRPLRCNSTHNLCPHPSCSSSSLRAVVLTVALSGSIPHASSLCIPLCIPYVSSGPYNNTFFWSTVYRWAARDCRLPDPGMYAVVGMSAFLGGPRPLIPRPFANPHLCPTPRGSPRDRWRVPQEPVPPSRSRRAVCVSTVYPLCIPHASLMHPLRHPLMHPSCIPHASPLCIPYASPHGRG